MGDVAETSDGVEVTWTRRLAHILERFADDISRVLGHDRSAKAQELLTLSVEQRARQVVTLITAFADPTKNKRFTPWLAHKYVARRLILEDLGTAHETLTMFQRYSPRLKPDQRDIHRYGSLADAWDVVRSFAERDEVHSTKAQKAIDRAKAYEESRILHQDPDGLTVAIPMTEFAAKWWGKGTRWCTAAEKDNRFAEYHARAPLIVISLPDLGKFQFWITPEEFQFVDAADEPVSIHTIWPQIDRFAFIFRKGVSINGKFLNLVPKEYQTHEICISAVRQFGGLLREVDHSLRSKEVCLEAVRQRAEALCWVPTELRGDWGILQAAVQNDGEALSEVPRSRASHEIHIMAVQQAGRALRLIPPIERTREICRAAIAQCGTAIAYVPQQFLTELALEAVKAHGNALNFLPQWFRTKAVCLRALRAAPAALRSVPRHYLNQKLCNNIVSRDPGELRWIPEKFMTEELLSEALRTRPACLAYIPEKLRTEALCRIAVEAYGGVLDEVPLVFRTLELCLAAVLNCGGALRNVPNEYRTQDICLAAVQQDGAAILEVPHELLTREICEAAIEQGSEFLDFFPTTRTRVETILGSEFWASKERQETSKARSQQWSEALLDEWQIEVGQRAPQDKEPALGR